MLYGPVAVSATPCDNVPCGPLCLPPFPPPIMAKNRQTPHSYKLYRKKNNCRSKETKFSIKYVGKKKMEKRDGMIEGKESNWQLILKEIKKLTFAF